MNSTPNNLNHRLNNLTMNMTPETLKEELKTTLTGQQFTSYKLALNRIILSITMGIIPALKQRNPGILATLPDNAIQLTRDIQKITDLATNEAVKKAGRETIHYLPGYETACQLGDFNTVFVFKDLLLNFYTAAHNSLKRRVKFQIN